MESGMDSELESALSRINVSQDINSAVHRETIRFWNTKIKHDNSETNRVLRRKIFAIIGEI